MVLASSVNDNIAKSAARAASNQYPPTDPNPNHPHDPQNAAKLAIEKLLASANRGILMQLEPLDLKGNNLPSSKYCVYDDQSNPQTAGYVVCSTRLTMSLPIPVIGFPPKIAFTTSSKVPIVSVTAK